MMEEKITLVQAYDPKQDAILGVYIKMPYTNNRINDVPQNDFKARLKTAGEHLKPTWESPYRCFINDY